MARISPWGLRRPERKQETRTFTDPTQPGVELTLTLRELGGVDLFRMTEIGQEYIKEWVTSGNPIPAEGGSILVNETLCNAIAMLEAMQVPDGEDTAYNLLEWVGFCVNMPHAFKAVVEWAASLVNVETEGGNASGVVLAPSPALPSP